MGLVDLIKNKVEKKPTILPDQLRKSKPLRNPAVQYKVIETGEALLEALLENQGRSMAGTLAKWMKMPDATRKFELEPVGAFVWEMCDGKTTFDTMSKKLREKYKMNRLEAEASLTAFLQMLSQRKLITLLVAK